MVPSLPAASRASKGKSTVLRIHPARISALGTTWTPPRVDRDDSRGAVLTTSRFGCRLPSTSRLLTGGGKEALQPTASCSISPFGGLSDAFHLAASLASAH